MWENRCLSQYIAKCKHTQKKSQIISKFYEVLSHILNMNNCTIPITIEKFDSCDFTKNIQTSFSFKQAQVCWKKTYCWKIIFIWRWQELCYKLLYQKSFYMFIKMLDEFKEKLPLKYTKIYPEKNIFSCLKWPPCNVLSSCSQDLSLVHLCC